ncbi:hypothetical protein NN561_005683 [Cricetulus griseus]
MAPGQRCFLDLQPLWLPKGEMLGTHTGPQDTGSSLEPHQPSVELAETRPTGRPSTGTERIGRSDDWGRRGLTEAPAPPAASTAARARALPGTTAGLHPH